MAVRCLYPLFVVLIFAVSGATDLKREVGGEVSFKPIPTLSSGNTITWKFKDEGGSVIRVIEFDHGESKAPQNRLFRDNAAVDKNTGELTLNKLRKDHSGLYYFEINTKEQELKFTLRVMEGVQKPEINSESTSNPTIVYLNCKYNKIINENAKISWKCSDAKPNQTTDDSLTYTQTGNPDTCCKCTLTNDVSNKTSDQICESVLFPGGSNIFGVVLGVILVVIIIILILFLLYLYNNKVHNCIYPRCKDKTCIGGMVESLEGLRNKKNHPNEEEEKANEQRHLYRFGTTQRPAA